MAEHHLMRLATKARLLVAAERSSRRVRVVAIHPHTTRLNSARHLVRLVSITSPHASTKPVDRIVCDGDGLFVRLEGGHSRHGSKDLFLEDSHGVGSAEDGGLD